MDSVLGPDVTVRELPPEEYELLRKIYPFNEIGPPDPSLCRCVVAQRTNDAEIVGFFFVSTVVHLEPLWIHEAYRGRPGLLRRLWRVTKQVMLSTGHRCGFAIIAERDLGHVAPQANRIGFRAAPGGLYYVNLEKAERGAEKLDPTLRFRGLGETA